jgi:hypothetical protein
MCHGKFNDTATDSVFLAEFAAGRELRAGGPLAARDALSKLGGEPLVRRIHPDSPTAAILQAVKLWSCQETSGRRLWF